MKLVVKNPMRTSVAKLLAVAVSAAGFSVTGHAALLTFQPPVTIASDSVLDNPLSFQDAVLVQAQRWGGGALTVTTSNQSITFSDGVTAVADMPGTSTTTILYNAGEQSNAAIFAGDTGNANFNTLLDGNGWHNNISDATRPLTLRIGGLSIGTSYVVSLFTSDDRAGDSTTRTQQYWDSFSAGTFSGGSSSSFAQFEPTMVLATFTATGTVQDIFIRETDAIGNDDTHLSAFTLYSYTIPEPSSCTLLGLAAVALARRRRHLRLTAV